MKVFQINFYNTQFYGKKCYSVENWTALRKVLTQPCKYGLNTDGLLETNSVPALKKAHFEYSDYESLSQKEKLIINILNKKRAELSNDWDGRIDLSIKKDAERILELASKTKEYFDNKYKNGYRLVGIGNSPAPIVETMQILGADAVTLPFSKAQIEASLCYAFPYEHFVPLGHGGKWEKCSAKDWEEYFRFYGVDKDFSKDTGKALIFTDYICEGWTRKYLETILKGIGFDKNYEFIETAQLLPPDIQSDCGFDLDRCLDISAFKGYAKMISPKLYMKRIDILKHPEFIPSLPENLKSKLFRCALYDLIGKK